MRRLAVGLVAGCFGEPPPAGGPVEVPVSAVADEVQVDRSDVVQGLVRAPGREDVLAHCTACHSTALITQNRMTRERWDHTITWMQETQKLWPIPEGSRARILDYLEQVQGLDGEGDPDSPWSWPTYRPNPIW